jgi:hypothetical protein
MSRTSIGIHICSNCVNMTFAKLWLVNSKCGRKPIDMSETFGLTLRKTKPLCVVIYIYTYSIFSTHSNWNRRKSLHYQKFIFTFTFWKISPIKCYFKSTII